MQIAYEETHSNDRIDFLVAQCSIQHRIDATIVGIPPDRRMTLIFTLKFADVVHLMFIVMIQILAVPDEVVQIVFRIGHTEKNLFENLRIHERWIELVEILGIGVLRGGNKTDWHYIFITLLSSILQRVTEWSDVRVETFDL